MLHWYCGIVVLLVLYGIGNVYHTVGFCNCSPPSFSMGNRQQVQHMGKATEMRSGLGRGKEVD